MSHYIKIVYGGIIPADFVESIGEYEIYEQIIEPIINDSCFEKNRFDTCYESKDYWIGIPLTDLDEHYLAYPISELEQTVKVNKFETIWNTFRDMFYLKTKIKLAPGQLIVVHDYD